VYLSDSNYDNFSQYTMYNVIINTTTTTTTTTTTATATAAVELSLGGSSPYASTDKTNENKYT